MNANIPRIQHNIVAMNAYRNYSANSKKLTSSIEKLSSGYRINRAGDDAAGLAISEKMRAQISGLTQAKKNANDGINLIQTAEGAMTEVHDMLNRMVTLAEQSANGTYDDSVDRFQLQKEVNSLKEEINRIADSTNYNGIKLLDGSLSGTKPDEASTVGMNITGINLDATKAKSEIEFKAFDTTNTASGKNLNQFDDSSITLNIGLSDGTSKEVTLNFKMDGNNLNITDKDGTVLNTFKGDGSGKFGSTAGQKGVDLQDAVTEAFRKAIKGDDELGKIFNASVDKTATGTITGTDRSAAGANALVLEAKEAGADGITVKSVDLTASNSTTAALVKASNMATPTNANTAIMPAVTKGTDSTLAFKAEDITLYNDNYVDSSDGHKGNADKAVFEVNGVKFAVGRANQSRTNLEAFDSDVHFISLKEAAAAAGDNSGVSLTEAVGEGKTSDGTAAADATVVLDASALKQIANQIAMHTGVEVNFNNTDYKATVATFDDGEKITGTADDGSTALTATQGVPLFTIGKKIGTEGRSLTLQIGDTSDKFNQLSVSVNDLHVKAMGLDDVDISTQEGAAKAMDAIKSAVNYVSDVRGGLGALQNRLDHTINNLGVMQENIQSAESAIRDTDVAEEMMNYTKMNILNQAAQAMLAQANQLPQGVLQLIG